VLLSFHVTWSVCWCFPVSPCHLRSIKAPISQPSSVYSRALSLCHQQVTLFSYKVFQEIKLSHQSEYSALSNLSPTQLGVRFHDKMQQLIGAHKDLDLVLPRRHQPHNGRVTNTSNIKLSIQNLVELCDQFNFLDSLEKTDNSIIAKPLLS
jgi:hypothetical protein